jgi:hypothetical protein
MASESQAVSVIARLNRLTQEGVLRWRRRPANKVSYPGDGSFDVVYWTEYEGKNVAVFELSFRDYDPEHDEVFTSTRAVVALCDPEGRLEWEFPRTPNAWDLLEAIRFRTHEVETFFDRVLKGGN